MDIFAIRLNQLIKENNITKYKLAKEIKVSKQSVLYWCSGKSEAKGSNIREIAIYFDVSTDYLLGLENENGTKVNNIHVTNSGTITNSFNNKQ